jgi:NAD(P)H-dependent flavin oxidoreductase YrpB (nitropropane dioxygenase family)
MIKTKITEMFGIKYPIFSAPMGPFYTQALAAAVSEAGGLGVLSEIGLWGVDPLPEMKKHMEYVVEHTDKPFGFNIRTSRVEMRMAVRMCREIPKFIMDNPKLREQCIYAVTSAGSSKVMPESQSYQKLKESGSQIKHFHVVPAFWLAEKCVKYGVDGLCVTGTEGGGHQAYEKVGTNVLMTQVQQAFPDVPKIAAGGIGTGIQLAGAITMGYGGVVMGTRFISSNECEFPQQFKDLIPSAKAEDTVLIQGVLANVRVYNNKYAQKHSGSISKEQKLNYEKKFLQSDQWEEDVKSYDRVYDGDVVDTCLPMGQAAGVTQKIESVSDIIESVMKEAENYIKQVSKVLI